MGKFVEDLLISIVVVANFAVNAYKQVVLEAVVQCTQNHAGVSLFGEDAALLLEGYIHCVGLKGQSLYY